MGQRPVRPRPAPTADGADPAAATDPTESRATGLDVLVRRGLTWSFASSVLSRATNLVSGIVLAHILSPHDFGLFTVASVVLVLLTNLNDLGVEQSLVRWPRALEPVAPTAVSLVFGFSALLFGGFYVGAPWFAGQLGSAEATGIVRVLAIGLLINGACAIPSALLTRSFRQDRKAAADLTGFGLGIAITVVLALLGFGPWALAWGRLIGNGVNSALVFVLAPRRYRPGWSSAAARELLGSGVPLAMATIVTILVVNTDYIVVGRTLGAVALGIYTLAFNLSSWPYNLFSQPVARVSVPAFATLQHDRPALGTAFSRSLALMIAVTAPLGVLLSVMAGPAVTFIYGERWAPAAPVLVFLALLGLARVCLQFCFDLLTAVGRSRPVMYLQLTWLATLAPALYAGIALAGLPGAGIAHVAVAYGVMVPAFGWALRRAGIDLREVARAARRPLAGLPVVALGAVAARLWVPNPLASLAVAGVWGVAVYLPFVGPLLPGRIGRGLSVRGRRSRAGAAGQTADSPSPVSA